MAKALKTAGMVIAGAALIATGIGAAASVGLLGASAAAAATAAGTFTLFGVSISTLSAIGAGLSALGTLLTKRPGLSTGGSPVQQTYDPSSGLPYPFGRTAVAGRIVYGTVTGPLKEGNKYRLFYSVISGVRIDGFESFSTNDETVSFSSDAGEGASGTFKNRMWQVRRSGAPDSRSYLRFTATGTKDTPADHGGNPPEWTAQHTFGEMAVSLTACEYDQKVYASDVKPMYVIRAARVYDPRLDDTYPGGAGACRANDENTFVWSENPWLHALTWAMGRYQNGARVLGIGAALAFLPVSMFVEGANIADANGWKIGGTAWSTDDKWAVLRSMAQAGGGECFPLGGKIGCMVNAPRVSLATVEPRDIVGPCSAAGTRGRRDRINGAVPRYRSEAHGWEIVAADPITVAAHVAEDRNQQRTREIDYPYVQDLAQAGQLARYDIENSREFGPITLKLGPKWMGFVPGDALTLNVPDLGLNGQLAVITKRAFDPSTFSVTLELRSETTAKHAFALGQTTTAPPIPTLTGNDALMPGAPPSEDVTVEGGVVAGPGGSLPVIVYKLTLSSQHASHVIVDYRQITPTVGEWRSREWPVSALAVDGDDNPIATITLDGLAAGATYQSQIRYRSVRGVEDPTTATPLPDATTGGVDAGTVEGKTPAQIVADSGAALAPALDALEGAATAAQVTASAALTALQDPSNGALVRLDRMSKKGSGDALNPNGDFRDWPTSSPYPTGYGFWVAPTALARASTPLGDALDMTSGAGQQCGFLIQAAAMSPPAAGASKVVLEADIELVSGGLAGAALYLQADDGSPGFGNAAGVAVRFTDVVGAGVAGKSYRIRSEPLSLPYVASWTRYVLIAMNHWTGAGSIAAANRIRWLRAEAFVASDVEAGYAEDIALLTGADSVAAARISGVEAKQRSLPNLIKNGDASASTTADPLKSWAASAAGMVEPAYDAGYGSLWRLKANTTGASYYFETALSATPPPGSAMAFSLSGAPGDGTRRYYVAWYNAGAYVAETAPVALTAATLDWEDKRAPLLTSVPAGANQFKVVVVSPAGAGEALLTRLMVNRGASPVPFNNAATDREGLARTAAVELGLVTSDAALANLTNRVGVSMQQGSSIVANARFGAYTNPTGVPDGWLDAALGSTAARQNGQGGHFAPRFVVAEGQDKAIRQVVYLTPGRWVMEFQAWISAGDALGAGMQISRVDNGAVLGVLRCASDPDDNGGVGQGGPGIRRWTKTIDVTYAGDVNIYAFAGYTGLGAVTAKVIDLFVVDLWPVSAPVRAAQADASTALTGVSNLSYSLSTLEGQTSARFTSPTGEVQVAKSEAIAQSLANTNQAISDFNLAALSSAGGLSATASAAFSTAVDAATKLAVGRIMLETVGGGGAPSRLLIYSDEYGGSAVVLSAKQIGFGDNTLFDDATDTLRTVTGGVARVIAWGAPFGSTADLLEWIGDASVALAAMSKANAYYFTSSTAPYVGGSGLPSGGAVDAVLSKSAEGTNLTPNTATHTIVAQIDFGGVAASDLVEGWLGFSGVGATLSSVGAWVGGWEIVEQTTAGGSTHVVGSGGLQIEDAGGGFVDFQVTPDGAGTWSALTPRNLNGSVRYALRLWRASGPDLGGDGITAVLRVRRTP